MTAIEVQTLSDEHAGRFRVTLTEGGGETTHEVVVPKEYYDDLTGGACTADELVRASFEFLLEREPKESILREFDLTVISRYFPEYEAEMRERLGG